MLTFESPLYLLLLLLLPPAVYFRHYWGRRGGRLLFSFRIWRGRGFRPSQRGVRFGLLLMYFLYWASLAAIVTAMAGPSLVSREKIYLSKGTDVMMVLDESPSMGAKDFPPENRFETAKRLIRDFARGRENDAVGLVSFGKEAVLRVPPTMDYERFEEKVAERKLMTLGDGTAVGMGIAVAVLHLQKSSASEKVIVLLTDGANNQGEIQPRTAAEIARERGVRIYTIGLGSGGTVPVEFANPETGKHYVGLLEESFDEALLREMASETGGLFFHAVSPRSLESIFEAIDSIESAEKRFRIEVRHRPLHREIILAAVLLFFLSGFFRKWLWGEVL